LQNVTNQLPDKPTATLAILGSGAIGHLLAAHFTQASIKHCLITRSHKLEEYRQRGPLAYIDHQNQAHQLAINYVAAEQLTNIDLLIITLKSYQLADAITPILPRLSDRATILILCNGLGHQALIEQQLKQAQVTAEVFSGTLSHGAVLEKLTPLTLTHHGLGEIVLGNAQAHNGHSSIEQLYQLFKSAKLAPTVTDNILDALYLKAAVNAIINPLTALFNIKNGELLIHPESAPLMQPLKAELIKLFEATGINISTAQLTAKLEQIIDKTANNHSSMLMDVIQQRPTEIDAINGFFIEQAQKHGLILKTHLWLFEQIKQIEQAGNN
jgi:2-dehydropantoate 2-reductase